MNNEWDVLYDEGRKPLTSTTYTQTDPQILANITPEDDNIDEKFNYGKICFILFWSIIWVFITITIKWQNPAWVVFSILSWYVLLYFTIKI